MDIRDFYTKELDNRIRDAIKDKKPFRLSNINNGFVKHLQVNKEGIIFKYNTYIPSHSGITADGFLKLDYELMAEELEKVYNKTQTNSLYDLIVSN